ncbi:MAG: hypothetical protein ACXVXU_02265 [Blastococcus sp.]
MGAPSLALCGLGAAASPPTVAEIDSAPPATSLTLRLISWVVAVCSSTAVAIADW